MNLDLNRYEGYKEKLLAERKILRSYTHHTKIQGDYYEALIRDFIRKQIPKSLKVGYGLIYNGKSVSRECDVIIYDPKEAANYEFKDLLILDSKNVKIVMQIKSVLTSKTLKGAIENLKAVKSVRRNILCWIFGFKTDLLLKTSYLKAWRSGAVQFLHVLQSNCKTENKDLLNSQMKFFMDLLRLCTRSTDPTMPKRLPFKPNDFVIYANEERPFLLLDNIDVQRVDTILDDIYSKGFWNLWNSKYNYT